MVFQVLTHYFSACFHRGSLFVMLAGHRNDFEEKPLLSFFLQAVKEPTYQLVSREGVQCPTRQGEEGSGQAVADMLGGLAACSKMVYGDKVVVTMVGVASDFHDWNPCSFDEIVEMGFAACSPGQDDAAVIFPEFLDLWGQFFPVKRVVAICGAQIDEVTGQVLVGKFGQASEDDVTHPVFGPVRAFLAGGGDNGDRATKGGATAGAHKNATPVFSLDEFFLLENGKRCQDGVGADAELVSQVAHRGKPLIGFPYSVQYSVTDGQCNHFNSRDVTVFVRHVIAYFRIGICFSPCSWWQLTDCPEVGMPQGPARYDATAYAF